MVIGSTITSIGRYMQHLMCNMIQSTGGKGIRLGFHAHMQLQNLFLNDFHDHHGDFSISFNWIVCGFKPIMSLKLCHINLDFLLVFKMLTFHFLGLLYMTPSFQLFHFTPHAWKPISSLCFSFLFFLFVCCCHSFKCIPCLFHFVMYITITLLLSLVFQLLGVNHFSKSFRTPFLPNS